jgi:hypothetical protein
MNHLQYVSGNDGGSVCFQTRKSSQFTPETWLFIVSGC